MNVKKQKWVLAAAGILLIPVASAVFAHVTQLTYSTIISTLTTLTSLFLTLVLAYLYANFSAIQTDQKKIMEQQKELSIRQVSAKPEIKSLSVSTAKDGNYRFGRYRDETYFTIMNHGESVMEDVSIVCIIKDTENPQEYILDLDTDTIQPTINGADALDNFGDYGKPGVGMCPPKEEKRFRSDVTFQRKNESGALAISVSDVLSKCKESGIDSVDFYLAVVYSDSAGEDKIQRLTGFIADIDRETTMEEAFENDNTPGLVMDNDKVKSNTIGT